LTALEAGVTETSAGDLHTCALEQDGTVWCWGGNEFGQLAEPLTLTERATPGQIPLGYQ
jgi:alpha-tubulin suppressor-like RCC1 family protein